MGEFNEKITFQKKVAKVVEFWEYYMILDAYVIIQQLNTLQTEAMKFSNALSTMLFVTS